MSQATADLNRDEPDPVDLEHIRAINWLKSEQDLLEISVAIHSPPALEWLDCDRKEETLVDKLATIYLNATNWSEREKEKIISICTILVFHHPNLLTASRSWNGWRVTTLYKLICADEGKFSFRFLTNFMNEHGRTSTIELEEPLLNKCGPQAETCLHAIVRTAGMNSGGPKLLDILLSKFQEKRKALIQKDKNGLTLLHYATLLLISKEQRDIIRLMIDDCEPADLKIQDCFGRTPLHLVAARANTDYDIFLGKFNRQVEIDFELSAAQVAYQLEIIKMLIDEDPELLMIEDENGMSPYKYRTSVTFEGSDIQNKADTGLINEDDPGRPSLNIEDPISYYLIDQCMHLDQYEDILAQLYDNHIKDITFDLFENPQYIDELIKSKDLNNLSFLSYWNFEQVLRYVAIPKHPRYPPPSPLAGQLYQGAGRRELVSIFQWLRSKGVKKIIEVIVDDSLDPPHGDERIEEALEGLVVEKFDWKKEDIDVQTLHKAVPEAEELCLYCSGNRSVLTVWAGINGLVRMKNLRKVVITIRQCYDSQQRIEQLKSFFIEQFDRSLQSTNRSVTYTITIEHVPPTLTENNPQVKSSKLPSAEIHDWFTGLRKFTCWLGNYLDGVHEAGPPVPPVKIALIDDGVDGFNKVIRQRLKTGISFCTGIDLQGRSRILPWSTAPKDSHGTALAMLICRVCPVVEFYVARLNHTYEGRFVEKSAVDAIKWATAHNVDIISMSWTITKTSRNTHTLLDLTSAISAAHAKKIILLNSVPDTGLHGPPQERIYPTHLTNSGVIRIGAATLAGTVSPWSGRECDYVFPGEEIVMSADGHPSAPTTASPSLGTSPPGVYENGDKTVYTGSSYATALAAGVAAIAILFSESKVGGKFSSREEFRDYWNVRKAFEVMSVPTGQGPRFVKPWTTVFTEEVVEEEGYFDDEDGWVRVREMVGEVLYDV